MFQEGDEVAWGYLTGRVLELGRKGFFLVEIDDGMVRAKVMIPSAELQHTNPVLRLAHEVDLVPGPDPEQQLGADPDDHQN